MGLILVVSEDPVEIETIKAAMSVHGWWVTVAADRQAALQVAADQAPKLVVVDSDVTNSIDLLKSFGSQNGGPGVLTCVPEGFDGALELKEAGGDEILTKPVSSAGIFEAVQRCLAAPRPSPDETAAPSTELLTTEEIFGDVLREIEEGEAGLSAAAAAAPEPAEDVFEPAPETEPVVCLAGLFDEPEAPEPVEPAAPPQAETVEVATADLDEWQGQERRGADRPWSSAAHSDALQATDELFESVPDGARDEDATPSSLISEPPLEVGELEVLKELEELEELDEVEEIVESASADDTSGAAPRRVPRSALAIGSIAAGLLVVAGVAFVLNRGSEPPGDSIPPAEAVRLTAESAEESPSVVAAPPPAVPLPEEPLEAEAAEVESLASTEPAEPEEVEELNLEAIVDQELERREEALRRVFLEEEKRLLRELNDLEPEEAPADGADEGDAEDEGGVGR